MNNSSQQAKNNMSRFLEDVNSKCRNILKELGQKNVYIQMDVMLNKYNELHPNDVYKNVGLFLRSANKHIPALEYVSSTFIYKNKTRIRYIILHYYSDRKSDIARSSDQINPVTDINDSRI